MQILGLNKTTLLDYPEHVAATLFTGGCNFRCPFCQNGDLALHPVSLPAYDEAEIFSFLKKRAGILTGVCISGGEPTLQPDLADFIARIKNLGYLIKLDTNGYCPDILESLIQQNLLDYVAMDIKNSLSHYAETAGLSSLDTGRIQASVSLLMTSSLSFEFRTTVVKELHCAEDFEEIGNWLSGCPVYYLQSYKDSEAVLTSGFHAYDKETLLSFREILLPHILHTHLRGVD